MPDRLGFHYTVMALALWPLLLLSISEVWKEKDAVSRDVADRLYSRLSLIVSKVRRRPVPPPAADGQYNSVARIRLMHLQYYSF